MKTLLIFAILMGIIFMFFAFSIVWRRDKFKDYDDTIEKEMEEMKRFYDENETFI